MEAFNCVRCREADLTVARRKMVAARVSAKEQAGVLKALRDLTGGWREQPCQHAQSERRAMPAAAQAALLGEASVPEPSTPSAEASSFLEIAQRNAPLEAEPEHAAAALSFERARAEREEREREESRRLRQTSWRLRHDKRAEKTREYRRRMKAQGLIETRQDPGPLLDEEDYINFVQFKVETLGYNQCRNFGRDAIRCAVEVATQYNRGPNLAAAVLSYAQRVHRGLVRNWVSPQVAAQVPHLVVRPNAEEDAYLHFDCEHEDNDLEPYDAGPSKKWQQKQADNSYTKAARARAATASQFTAGITQKRIN